MRKVVRQCPDANSLIRRAQSRYTRLPVPLARPIPNADPIAAVSSTGASGSIRAAGGDRRFHTVVLKSIAGLAMRGYSKILQKNTVGSCKLPPKFANILAQKDPWEVRSRSQKEGEPCEQVFGRPALG